MIELGGHIKLDGFESVEPALLVVVKKVIGNYVKQISEKNKEFKEITVKNDNNEVSVICICDKEITAKAKADNLFFSLSKALEETLKNC